MKVNKTEIESNFPFFKIFTFKAEHSKKNFDLFLNFITFIHFLTLSKFQYSWLSPATASVGIDALEVEWRFPTVS